MNECLEALEREHESPLDAMLVQQVRSNRVVEKANLSVVSEGYGRFQRTVANQAVFLAISCHFRSIG